MAVALSRRVFAVNSVMRFSRVRSFCSKFAENVRDVDKVLGNGSSLSQLIPDDRPHLDSGEIQVVDDDAWRVSSGLAQAWRGSDCGLIKGGGVDDDWIEDRPYGGDGDVSDFDVIDNMRVRGSLFYKLERSSKEFEEYSFEFHRRKGSHKKTERRGKEKDNRNESNKKETVAEKLPKVSKLKTTDYHLNDTRSISVERKKVRTQTYNQLTGPYHEPFCLDIYISKASVRACIIHRVTSKVVAVAHSISKDMKFDLASTRNAAACDAVGVVLAQRALADDIHDIIYTPRKGEKIEGKLQTVLQTIINNGINVKVKLKQRKPKKDGHHVTPLKLTM